MSAIMRVRQDCGYSRDGEMMVGDPRAEKISKVGDCVNGRWSVSESPPERIYGTLAI